MEKLGALGPLGLAWLFTRFRSPLNFGCIKRENSPLFLGSDDDVKGEIIRGAGVPESTENGASRLESLGGRSA
jgi:hypothetical protein